MNILTFFGIAVAFLAVLCYLDLQRTNRRTANRRAWERYFAARQHRLNCQEAWEQALEATGGLGDSCPPELLECEARTYAAALQAMVLEDVARLGCKGKCPKDLT